MHRLFVALVACSPVACSPVGCSPVVCLPGACSPVACSPVACSSIAGLHVHQFSVCMMASRAGDATAGDLRQRFLRRAQLGTQIGIGG